MIFKHRGLSLVIFFITFFLSSRYKYSCFYELDSLAVVNVRDLGGIKHTFKLLVFPEPRLFQCANAEAKKVIYILFSKDFCSYIHTLLENY